MKKIALFFLSVVVIACGGIDKDKPLDEMSTEDLQTWCGDLSTDFNDWFNMEDQCMMSAISYAQFVDEYGDGSEDLSQECQDEYDDCITDNSVDTEEVTLECESMMSTLGETENCTVTLNEIEACFEEMSDYMTGAVEGLTCQSSNIATVDLEGSEDDFPISCLAVFLKCEELFSSLTGSDIEF